MVELFAGVGGFRLGLEPHGWETVWANQWEPFTKAQHAADCYELISDPNPSTTRTSTRSSNG